MTSFALRLHARASVVVEKYNKMKQHQPPQRRMFVLRGYHFSWEANAFISILETGVADNSVVPPPRAGRYPRWQLPLSPTNWLLAVLEAKALEDCPVPDAVKQLHPDDAQSLYDLQAKIKHLADKPGALQRLVKLARGELSWEDYNEGDMASKAYIMNLMYNLVNAADAVLTTPAGAAKKWYNQAWSNAAAIAVDEGGCMHVADLCSIWGNTLRPLGMAGDIKQLYPCMMELYTTKGGNKKTAAKVDKSSEFLSRLARNGRMSALARLQSVGLPISRLREQLRMARDLFGFPRRLFYSDLNTFTYGRGADPTLTDHVIGRKFEEYLAEQNFPDFKHAGADLKPAFLHTPHTGSSQVGTSLLNRQQVRTALDFLVGFVKAKEVDPADIAIISGHRPNVEYANRLVKKIPELAGISPVATVDVFQGREKPMILAITGLTTGKSSAFMSDEHRLNVLMTRPTSALLIVGDKSVTGVLEGTPAALKKANDKATSGFATYGPNGEKTYAKYRKLREMLLLFQEHGRFFQVPKPLKRSWSQMQEEEQEEEQHGEEEEEKKKEDKKEEPKEPKEQRPFGLRHGFVAQWDASIKWGAMESEGLKELDDPTADLNMGF